MPRMTDYRVVLSLGASALGGTLGLHAYPFPADRAVLALVHLERPLLHAGFTYMYAAVWFSSAFFLASIAFSCATIIADRGIRAPRRHRCCRIPRRTVARISFWCSGSSIGAPRPARCAQPSWLAIPERGLYTGILVVGAIGSGQTSVCMYPYVNQLLAYRAKDPARKAAGLVLEVTGDFCRQVRDILRCHG
jgi:hypothetical protein